MPLAMGHVNVIWQGDANARALQCLALAATPATMLNVTGPETVSIRWLAGRFGERLRRAPRSSRARKPRRASQQRREVDRAVRSTDGRAWKQMIDWTAEWLEAGGPLRGKPTKFEVRDGRF